jgi:hypothetical protein
MATALGTLAQIESQVLMNDHSSTNQEVAKTTVDHALVPLFACDRGQPSWVRTGVPRCTRFTAFE